MKTVLTIVMAVMTFISASAYRNSYSFEKTPISEAIVRISKDHPDVNISFIYDELDNYRTSAKVRTDDIEDALRRVIGLNPISIKSKDGSYFIEALQHGRFIYTGRTVGSDNEPVLATVMLLSPRDSTVMTYGMADSDGRFSVPCDCRDVIVRLSCIGYHTVSRHVSDFNIGEVVMTVNPTMLSQVSVTASKPFVKAIGTGFSVDIENSPLGDLPTVPDVLSQLPTVKSNGTGFSITGRGEAVVFIGNRKLTDMSELYRLRPSEIKSIEIIRNPGAEFDADAPAVIRIRLKKDVLKGFGIDMISQAGLGRRFSDYEQMSLSYGAGPTSSFLIFSNNSARLNSDQANLQDIYTPSAVWHMVSDMPHWDSEYYDWTLAAGSSINIADRHTLGAKIAYTNDTQHNGGYKYSSMTVDDVEYETLTARTSNPQGYRQWHTNIYYEGAISERMNLIFNGDYVNRKHLSTHVTDEYGSLTPHHIVINYDSTRYSLWSGMAKISWKLSDNSQASFGADLSIVNQSRHSTQNCGEQSAGLRSVDSKYAAFAQYDLSCGVWNLVIGLRYEADKMDYTDGATGSRILAKTYHRLYPDITLSARVGKTTMALGFNSRIRRPTFYELRTSQEYFNRYETTEGNPLLRPRYTYDISYSLGYKDFMANATYQWIYNSITEDSRIDTDTPLHLTSYPVNKPKYTAASLQLSYNHKFGIWRPYMSAQLTKTFYGISLRDGMPGPGKRPLFELSFSNYFSFCGTTAYIATHYNPAGAYCNSWEGRYIGIDMGVYRRFINKRLYVAINATNILHSRPISKTYYGTSIFGRTTFRDNQRLYLTVSYTFRHEDRYKGKTTAQDELNRMD